MSWKWFERMMYSVLGVSSAAAVSGLVALAVLIAGPPPDVGAKRSPRASGGTETGEYT